MYISGGQGVDEELGSVVWVIREAVSRGLSREWTEHEEGARRFRGTTCMEYVADGSVEQ